ncbi:PREDICTED: uncharacterized protein LOC106553537 [Thamnophis sirtalis]|uniref:Uncharacterized protein LOC106553537 n=1 Tax=Thamnophis sirtalis TaxID=35019 RepID=A0A6I9YSK9_9SAUR|nr:PREDICTED: uncharacterized protein LOC106553537 [Thamnophis sirtalis]
MALCGPSCALPSSASIPTVGFGSAGLGGLASRGLGLGPFPLAESSGSLGTLEGIIPSCINQIPPSEVTIQPPPVVVTIPGPILSASCEPVAVGGHNPCAPGGLGQGLPLSLGGLSRLGSPYGFVDPYLFLSTMSYGWNHSYPNCVPVTVTLQPPPFSMNIPRNSLSCSDEPVDLPNVVLYTVVPYHTVLYHVVLYHVLLYHVALYRVVLRPMAPYHVVSSLPLPSSSVYSQKSQQQQQQQQQLQKFQQRF